MLIDKITSRLYGLEIQLIDPIKGREELRVYTPDNVVAGM